MAAKPSCLCGTCKKCRQRLYMREWTAKNRERAREIGRESYHRHAEKRRQENRDFYYKDAAATKKRERENYVRNKAGGLVTASCKRCGAVFEMTKRSQERGRLFCSRLCKDADRRERLKQELLASKSERSCLQCGGVISVERRSDAVYCSEVCNSAAHHHTSKASFRIGDKQERVSRAYIMKRDGFRCHLCKKKFKESELTLDHLVPLARGGTHSVENLAAACLPCNCSKGARAANEQLRIVG